MQDCGASCKRLTDGRVQREVLGSRQNEPTRSAVLVDFVLEVAEEGRYVLDLVDDGSVRMLPKKPARILLCEGPGVERFQRDVGMV